MIYPRWFPYPGSWLRALILVVSLIPLIAVLRITNYSILGFLGFKWYWYRGLDFWLWFGIKGVIAPIVFFSLIHHLIWGEDVPKLPFWMPTTKSWLQGFWDWFVCVSALLLCMGIEYIRYDGRIMTVLDKGANDYLKVAFL